MKRMTLLVLLLVPCLLAAACSDSADKKDRLAVNRQQKQYSAAQPIPGFDWSLERDVAIQLYQSRNDRVRTWTVWRSNYGMIEGHCESIGYPIPYDVQLTNPLKVEYQGTGYEGDGVVEQPEPNGLFSSHNSIATWVRAVVPDGERTVEVPIYIESKVTCYPFPVTVDYESNRVIPVVAGKPSVVIQKRGP